MQLLRLELYKIFRKPRTYISFATITAITALIQIALLANGQELIDFVLGGVSEGFDVSGNIINGYFICFIVLMSLLVHVPLLVAMVAGDAIAGEAASGTLRLLLSKPVSRTKLLLTKFFASVVYSWLLLIWLAIMALGLSLLLFGTGDLINPRSEEFVLLLENDIFWRYLAAFGYAALAMMSIAALATLLSVFAENAIGPIVGTMGIVIVCTIINNLNVPLFNAVNPFLFTTHMLAWKGFFSDPVHYDAIGRSALVMVVYVVVLLSVAIYFFRKKDIQS